MENLQLRKLYALIFAFFLIVYLFIQPGHIYTSDTVARFAVTKSIVEHGNFSIPPEIFPKLAVRGTNGGYYAFAGIGQSILMLPFYLTGKIFASMLPNLNGNHITEFCASLLNAFVTAVTCLIFFIFGIKLGYSRKNSLLLTLIFGLATMNIVYARDSFEQPQETLFILIALLSIYVYTNDNNKKWLILSSLSIGFAVLTRIPSMAVIILILIYMALSRGTNRQKLFNYKCLLLYVLTFLPFLMFICWYNYVRFNSVFETGYTILWANSNVSPFSYPLIHGIYALLLSPVKGLIFHTPILILALPSWYVFHKKNKSLSILFLGITIFYVLFHAKSTFWDGGWCWGTRLLLPVIPLIILPLGTLLESKYVKNRIVKALFFALALIGFLEQLPAVPVNYARYRYTLDTTNVESKYIPVFLQWKMLFEVVDVMKNSNPAELPEKNMNTEGEKMLAKTRTLNIIDIWFVHLYYIGFPKTLPWFVTGIFTGILLLIGGLIRKKL